VDRPLPASLTVFNLRPAIEAVRRFVLGNRKLKSRGQTAAWVASYGVSWPHPCINVLVGRFV
jgi:hypothetical protein